MLCELAVEDASRRHHVVGVTDDPRVTVLRIGQLVEREVARRDHVVRTQTILEGRVGWHGLQARAGLVSCPRVGAGAEVAATTRLAIATDLLIPEQGFAQLDEGALIADETLPPAANCGSTGLSAVFSEAIGTPSSSSGSKKHTWVSVPSCLQSGGPAAPTSIGPVAMASRTRPRRVSSNPSQAPRGGLRPGLRLNRKAARGNATCGIVAPLFAMAPRYYAPSAADPNTSCSASRPAPPLQRSPRGQSSAKVTISHTMCPSFVTNPLISGSFSADFSGLSGAAGESPARGVNS